MRVGGPRSSNATSTVRFIARDPTSWVSRMVTRRRSCRSDSCRRRCARRITTQRFSHTAFLSSTFRDTFGATDIVISSSARGAALARALADKAVVLLRAHGFVAVGPSLQAAVFRAIFTEVSARVQLQAEALGGPLAALDEEEGRKADAINLATVGRSWEFWKGRVMP